MKNAMTPKIDMKRLWTEIRCKEQDCLCNDETVVIYYRYWSPISQATMGHKLRRLTTNEYALAILRQALPYDMSEGYANDEGGKRAWAEYRKTPIRPRTNLL